IRLLPRHLLENLQELTAQFLKEPYALFTRREPRLRRTRAECVEFVARRHHQSETRQLRQMGGQLTECARLGMRAPIVVVVGDALEHPARGRELRLEVGEEECYRREAGSGEREAGGATRRF